MIIINFSPSDCHHWTQVHHLSWVQRSASYPHLHWSADHAKVSCKKHLAVYGLTMYKCISILRCADSCPAVYFWKTFWIMLCSWDKRDIKLYWHQDTVKANDWVFTHPDVIYHLVNQNLFHLTSKLWLVKFWFSPTNTALFWSSKGLNLSGGQEVEGEEQDAAAVCQTGPGVHRSSSHHRNHLPWRIPPDGTLHPTGRRYSQRTALLCNLNLEDSQFVLPQTTDPPLII